MVRREIKSFEMEYASSKYKCEAPCSVRSALCAAGEVFGFSG